MISYSSLILKSHILIETCNGLFVWLVRSRVQYNINESQPPLPNNVAIPPSLGQRAVRE